MDITKFIKPELLALVPVLYFLAYILIISFKIDKTKVPLIIGISGIVMAAIYVIAVTDIHNYHDVLMAVFISVVQGFLCAGAAVYTNQLQKQKDKRGG
jgi:hypothetical protein